MGSSISSEGEPPQMRTLECAKPHSEGVVRMSVESMAGILNAADMRLKKIEIALTKHADSSELVAASLSKMTLLEDTLAKLANQIEELETKLDAVREAAIDLKTLEALDVPKVSKGVVDELSLRLRVGSDPVAQSVTNANIPEEHAAKMRRKRDL